MAEFNAESHLQPVRVTESSQHYINMANHHATCLHGRIPHNSRDDRSRQQKSIKQRKGGSNCDCNQHAIKWEQYDSTDDDEDGDEQQPCSNRKLAQLKWERY